MDRSPASRVNATREVLKKRAVPTFYVVDRSLRVVLACGSPTISRSDVLPPSIEPIVRNLMRQIRRVSDDALATDGDAVVRIIKPYASDADLMCVIIEKLRVRDPVSEAVKRHGMTNRQAEVLRLLMQGAPNTTIASQLHIAQATVEGHVKNIAAKTDSHSRSQVVARVLGFL
jgi:DNA-binding NarL/FixJ family response regulator